MLTARLRSLRGWRRIVLEAGLVFAVVAAVMLWQSRGLPEGPAPALAGRLLDGRPTDLPGQLQAAGGRPLLVAFWATWCPVCKAEAGNLEAVARDWPTVTVAMQSGDADAVARYLRDNGRHFPTMADDGDRMTHDWRVRGVPTHFVVDGKGRVRFRVVGYATEPGLRARLWWAQRFPE
ncbi:MAG TPA: protein disulfide oxidoreductase [Rhodocyclaceae bacterium]|nr:protein disulfide oxidoreductase [Rhodocyclaceae bacterium]